MKKLISYIFLLSPLLIMAQNDSVNISYSEERVENFEKTTLIDEYEKAFGNNRVVKSALRVSLNGVVPNTVLSQYSPYPFRTFMRNLNPILQFEQKISTDKSLIASFSSNRNEKDLFWNSDFGLEGRWYYQMKQRVAEGKQQPNITGKYLSLKVLASPYRFNNKWLPEIGVGAGTFLFRATSTYSLNWGWQFGNNINYGISAGVRHGNRAIINEKGFWVDGTLSGKTATTWFIATNAQAGLGLFLPLKKRTANNYCDFLKCNYEVKQLFKLNLNNTFYMDKYIQNLNLDIAYERKIGRSPFSVNSNLKAEFFNRFIYNPTGYKTDTVSNYGTVEKHTFSTKLQSYIGYNFEIAEQLRYYIGMNNRIAKGKAASNLNGLYIGVLGSYRLENQWFSSARDNYGRSGTYSSKFISAGVSLGYQIQTNRRTFMDISVSFLEQKDVTPIENPSPTTQRIPYSLINFSLKLGFAK